MTRTHFRFLILNTNHDLNPCHTYSWISPTLNQAVRSSAPRTWTPSGRLCQLNLTDLNIFKQQQKITCSCSFTCSCCCSCFCGCSCFFSCSCFCCCFWTSKEGTLTICCDEEESDGAIVWRGEIHSCLQDG